MLKELRGSDVIIECLLEQGVDTVFGYIKILIRYTMLSPPMSRLPAMRLTDIQEQQAERALLSQLQAQVLRTL